MATQQLPESHAITVTDDTFAAQIESAAGVALVDFWATWCGPCRAIAPTIQQLAGEYAGRATIAKLDTDTNPKTMVKYGVRSIPTLLFFKDGKEVDRMVGAAPRQIIEQRLQRHLGV